GIALMLCTVVLFKMKKDRYAWVPILPTVWLLACTLSAGWIKIFASDPAVGFLAQANRYRDAIARGELIAPSKDLDGMGQVMFNNYVNAGLTALFMLVVLSVLCTRWARSARRAPTRRAPTARPRASNWTPGSSRPGSDGRRAGPARLLRHPPPGLAAGGAGRAPVLRDPRLRQLRPANAREAPGPRADGLPHLLPRAPGSALRRARRVPLLLKRRAYWPAIVRSNWPSQ